MRPEIETRSCCLIGKQVAQFTTVLCFHAEIIFDWVMNRKQLPAHVCRLFEHQGIQTQLIAPTRSGKTGRPGADDQNVVHSSFVLLCAFATWREQSTSISRTGAKTQRRAK